MKKKKNYKISKELCKMKEENALNKNYKKNKRFV